MFNFRRGLFCKPLRFFISLQSNYNRTKFGIEITAWLRCMLTNYSTFNRTTLEFT